jgi:hypothetical protein
VSGPDELIRAALGAMKRDPSTALCWKRSTLEGVRNRTPNRLTLRKYKGRLSGRVSPEKPLGANWTKDSMRMSQD